jgi:hypothetical protein
MSYHGLGNLRTQAAATASAGQGTSLIQPGNASSGPGAFPSADGANQSAPSKVTGFSPTPSRSGGGFVRPLPAGSGESKASSAPTLQEVAVAPRPAVPFFAPPAPAVAHAPRRPPVDLVSPPAASRVAQAPLPAAQAAFVQAWRPLPAPRQDTWAQDPSPPPPPPAGADTRTSPVLLAAAIAAALFLAISLSRSGA